MASIVIPYYTGKGHTKKIAEFISKGALEVPNISCELIEIIDLNYFPWERLHSVDAIIFGSPTYMGSVAGLFKVFMDETANFWIEQKWSNKIAAGFTVGTSDSGDKLNSLVQMAVFAAQHGMIWVGQNHVGSMHTKDGLSINEAGSWLGMMAKSDKDKTKLISESDERTSIIFGKRVAEATVKWNK